jgi:selenocysteine lyase/cysteine desulfurase
MTTITLPELLRDETARRREFPICEKKVFLAHAGVSPLPRRVAEAMQRYLGDASRGDQENDATEAMVREARRLSAELIGAGAEEIAFVGSTSMGLAMVAAGLEWKPGDNLVCHPDDYPANVYPWLDLQGRGVEVRSVQPRQYGNVTVEDLEPLVDERTRLVALASAHFISGWRLDVDRIGQFLKQRGALFCLDGIQSFGALRTSVRHVDFAAADAHKWLLGPLGTAILYVRRERFEQLRPVLVGWHNAICPDYIAQDKLTFWPDARRYEPGSMNVAGLVGLRAALEMILSFGLEAVEARVLELAGLVIAGAQQRGYEILGPPAGSSGLSGIVTLASSVHDVAQIHGRLAERGIVSSLRRRRDGARYLRVSSHVYNHAGEIERLLACL